MTRFVASIDNPIYEEARAREAQDVVAVRRFGVVDDRVGVFGGGVPDTIADSYTCTYCDSDCVPDTATYRNAVCGGIPDPSANSDACTHGHAHVSPEPGAYFKAIGNCVPDTTPYRNTCAHGYSAIGCVSYAATYIDSCAVGVPDAVAGCDTCADCDSDSPNHQRIGAFCVECVWEPARGNSDAFAWKMGLWRWLCVQDGI